MELDFHKYIWGAWIAVIIVWFVGTLVAKRTVRRQAGVSRLLQVGIGVAVFFLIYKRRMWLGFLTQNFVPRTPAVAWLGLILTYAGCAFAILARFYLGGNWSGTVTIKENHTLVRRGPYALVRNPIYTGFLVGLLGTALASGHLRDLVAVVVLLLMFVVKIRVEERFMTEQFGEQYRQYMRETKALIPYIW